MYESKKPYFYGTGRRKQSVARVRVYEGTGNITINNRDIDDYFGLETLKLIVRQPMQLTETLGKFDIVATVVGGGVMEQLAERADIQVKRVLARRPRPELGALQAGAIRHGLARAMLKIDPNYRTVLKKAGLLTRDPRMKERKKPGLKAARRAPQFSKR